MKYLVLLSLLVGCADPQSFVGKCYKPYIYSGEVVKVINCTNKKFYEDGSNFCFIQRKHFGTRSIFMRDLEDYSVEVDCSEF